MNLNIYFILPKIYGTLSNTVSECNRRSQPVLPFKFLHPYPTPSPPLAPALTWNEQRKLKP